MWSMRTVAPFCSPHFLAKSSIQASYAGTKWLQRITRSEVPLSCAGACRASSIARSAPPAVPAPVTLRKLRRVTVGRSACTSRESLIIGLLRYSWERRPDDTQRQKRLVFLSVWAPACQAVFPSYPRRHAAAAPGPRPRDRGDRRFHGGPCGAARHAASATRRLARRAPLLPALRHVPPPGRAGLLARLPLPDSSREPPRRRAPRSAL